MHHSSSGFSKPVLRTFIFVQRALRGVLLDLAASYFLPSSILSSRNFQILQAGAMQLYCLPYCDTCYPAFRLSISRRYLTAMASDYEFGLGGYIRNDRFIDGIVTCPIQEIEIYDGKNEL